jgi:hypothetical protein
MRSGGNRAGWYGLALLAAAKTGAADVAARVPGAEVSR